jgi:hypothetical protein
MASEILGLFGGQNPQQLRNAALDSMLISPSQMGSQGLLQQVVSMGQNAGTIAGMGAGRLLGGKVAGEVEASYLEQAIQAGQAGKTPTEKMKLVASFLEDKPGMGAQYMKALSEARRLEAEDFTMTQAKEKARTRTIKRQVDQFDPYTGKVIGQRSADITQVDSGKRDDNGNIIWEDLQQQDRTTQTPPAGGGSTGNAFDAEAKRREQEKAGKPQGGGGGERVVETASPDFTGRAALGNVREQAEKQKAIDTQAQQELDQENERLLRRSTPSFKTLAEKEAALRAAVKAGNYGLASQINKQPPFRKY